MSYHQNVESEAHRLQALVPVELECSIEVIETTAVSPPLIQSKSISSKLATSQYCIEVDFIRWFSLTVDQRNLLFWHEVSCIQNRTIGQHRSDLIALGIGLTAAWIEVIQQNVGLLALALTVSGLTLYQLYQHNWGERQLKNAVAADQSAIALATSYGYSRSRAYRSLYEGIRSLKKSVKSKLIQSKLEARLQVLEMLGAEANLLVLS